MNKFKAFFTFIAFFWLLLCGVGAICAIAKGYGSNSLVVWGGVWINAWALPTWMLLRYLKPQKLAGDLREPGALFGVLIGLAIVLLSDNERGLPVYLVIGNLFILLLYLYHLSAVRHPSMPALGEIFPPVEIVGDKNWRASAYCCGEAQQNGVENSLSGALVIFLRGSYCADSRSQLHQLRGLIPELKRRNLGLLLLSCQPADQWLASLHAGNQFLQLDVTGENAARFVAPSAAPFILRPWLRDAARPSAWLLDSEGYIVWRALAANYRVPAGVELLRGQLFRVED